MQELSLRKNFSWTFAGNLFYAASQWGILVLLAKLGSPEIVGRFAYALALTAPIVLFANLKLRSAQATDQKYEYKFGHYLGLRLLSSTVALFLIIFLAFWLCEDRILLFSVIFVGFAKVIESLSDVLYGLFQQHEQMDRIAHSLMIRGLATLVAVGALLLTTGDLVKALAGMCAVWLAVLLLHDVPKARQLLAQSGDSTKFRPIWERDHLQKLLVLTLPLGISIALGSLYINLPRYFIEHQVGMYELGIFSALAYFLVAGNTVINALGQSASPRLAKLYAAGNDVQFRRLMVRLIGIGTVIGTCGLLVVALAGREIITLVYTHEYADSTTLLLLLMVAAAIQYVYIFLGSAVNSMRLFRTQMCVTFVSTSILALACILLISRYQLYGAAVAMIASRILESILYVIIVKRFLMTNRSSCSQESNEV